MTRDGYTDEEWEEFVTDEFNHNRSYVALSAFAPAPFLLRLVGDPAYTVREDLALNPNLPDDAVRILAGDELYTVRRQVAYRDTLPTDVMALLANDSKEIVREAVARREDLPSELLSQLAEDEDSQVRTEVAQNLSITDAASVVLMKSPLRTYILEALTRNPNCSAVTLEELDKRKLETTNKVQKGVLSHPNCPTFILRAVLEEFMSVESNPFISSDAMLIEGIAANTSLPADMFEELVALHPSHNALVKNPSTPVSVLKTIARMNGMGTSFGTLVINRLMILPEFSGYPREWVEALVFES